MEQFKVVGDMNVTRGGKTVVDTVAVNIEDPSRKIALIAPEDQGPLNLDFVIGVDLASGKDATVYVNGAESEYRFQVIPNEQ